MAGPDVLRETRSRQALTAIQTDTRVGTIEVKIRKLDAELGTFKAQMAKMREGPGKVSHSWYISLCREQRDLLGYARRRRL